MKLPTLLFTLLAFVAVPFLIGGCAQVDVTKTGRGYYAPSNPNEVEILLTRPERHYIELGSITATKHQPGDTAKMHNTLRAKAAPLGATAVIILNQGFDAQNRLWVTGVAIRYEEASVGSVPATGAKIRH